KVRYRIDGVLREISSPPKRLQAAIISRIKILAEMNIAERRLPQDGRIRLRVGGRQIDVRVSTIPTLYGESVVMRILDKSTALLGLEELGMPPEPLARFRKLITRPHGILLVAGPAGTGRTTRLYAARGGRHHPAARHGRGAVPGGVVADGQRGAAAGAADLPAVQGSSAVLGRGAPGGRDRSGGAGAAPTAARRRLRRVRAHGLPPPPG